MRDVEIPRIIILEIHDSLFAIDLFNKMMFFFFSGNAIPRFNLYD